MWECACELLVCVVSAIDGVLFVCFLLQLIHIQIYFHSQHWIPLVFLFCFQYVPKCIYDIYP